MRACCSVLLFPKLSYQAEGIEQTKNQPVLITMKTSGTFDDVRPIVYPAGTLVPDSQKIRVTVVGTSVMKHIYTQQ